MKNEMQVIDQRQLFGKEFRIYGTYDEPLFLAKDVANWIEHNTPSELIQGVDEREKLKSTVSYSGQNREMWFLTEDGLYEVLMLSRKPIARAFKDEVKKILKSVRKNGAYMTESTLEQALTSPDFLIQLATTLKEEQEKRKLLEEENSKLNQVVVEYEPKAQFYDVVADVEDLLTIGESAKILGFHKIGRNTLYEILREYGILMKDNLPYQQYINDGTFKVREKVYYNKTVDANQLVLKTYVTQKGLDRIRKFLEKYVAWRDENGF